MLEILEGNKLIIEFMGIKPRLDAPDSYSWSDSPFFYCNERTPEKVMDAICKYSKYHTSWDWLMPVAEKCVCQITDADEEERLFAQIHDALWAFNIKAVWLAVVEFIKWYKSNMEDL